jgi:hypothetical protein
MLVDIQHTFIKGGVNLEITQKLYNELKNFYDTGEQINLTRYARLYGYYPAQTYDELCSHMNYIRNYQKKFTNTPKLSCNVCINLAMIMAMNKVNVYGTKYLRGNDYLTDIKDNYITQSHNWKTPRLFIKG